MIYNLILFAANGARLAEQVRTDESLLERTLQHIRELDVYNSDDLVIFADILRAGLSGNWPADGTTDPCQALARLLEFVGEPLTFAEFAEFKQFGTLEETGLLPYFRASDSSIPLPGDGKTVPLATVLINAHMATVLEKELNAPDPPNRYSSKLRTLLLDTIESLEPDGLDLFLIVIN